MLTTYLNTLKNQGNFTFETISNLSGIPEATVKNIFSGKTVLWFFPNVFYALYQKSDWTNKELAGPCIA